MKKKPKVKVVQGSLKDLAELGDLLKLLGSKGPEALEELAEPEDPCMNPLCPVCMFKGTATSEELGTRVEQTFSLCTKRELEQAATLMWGTLCKVYDASTEPNVEAHLIRDMDGIVRMLRKSNEKFNFATQTEEDTGEGAKH